MRAIISKGKVTGLQVEPISKEARAPMTPELHKLLGAVKKKIKSTQRGGPRFPVPVSKFFADELDISVTTITCIQICFFGWCIACCFNGDLAFCGKITIDGTNLPYPEPTF